MQTYLTSPTYHSGKIKYSPKLFPYDIVRRNIFSTTKGENDWQIYANFSNTANAFCKEKNYPCLFYPTTIRNLLTQQWDHKNKQSLHNERFHLIIILRSLFPGLISPSQIKTLTFNTPIQFNINPKTYAPLFSFSPHSNISPEFRQLIAPWFHAKPNPFSLWANSTSTNPKAIRSKILTPNALIRFTQQQLQHQQHHTTEIMRVFWQFSRNIPNNKLIKQKIAFMSNPQV